MQNALYALLHLPGVQLQHAGSEVLSSCILAFNWGIKLYCIKPAKINELRAAIEWECTKIQKEMICGVFNFLCLCYQKMLGQNNH